MDRLTRLVSRDSRRARFARFIALSLVVTLLFTNAAGSTTTHWSERQLVSTLNQGAGGAFIEDFNCTSSTFCVAGGVYHDSYNLQQSFVSVYNGTDWADHEIASSLSKGSNGGANGDSSLHLTCRSSTFCVAYGRYLDLSNVLQAFVSVYNGTNWSDQELAGSLNVGVNGANTANVTCHSVTFCVASGWYRDAANVLQTFTSVYNGSTWSTQELASSLSKGTNGASISNVTCHSSKFCIAYGSYSDVSNRPQIFVSIYNGSTWSDNQIASSLSQGVAGSTLAGVTCRSSKFCVAYGDYADVANDTQAFVAVYNGSNWSNQELASILNLHGAAEVDSVFCTSSTFCTASGSYHDGSSTRRAFASIYNGSTWSDQAIATTFSNGVTEIVSGLVNVTCRSTTLCIASGNYQDGGAVEHPFVSVYNGSTWADQELASGLSVGTNVGLNSNFRVICYSTSFCVASGLYGDSSNVPQVFVSVYNGTSWNSQQLASSLTAGTNGTEIVEGVTCRSSSLCLVDGNYSDSGNTQYAFVSVYNGTSWNSQQLAGTLGGASNIENATCRSSNFCVGGGSYYSNTSHDWHGFVSIYNGSNWSSQELSARLSGYTFGHPHVTCLTVTFCAAYGAFKDSGNIYQDFVAVRSTTVLQITNTVFSGVVGRPVILTTTGGTGVGPVRFVVTGAGCRITHGSVSAKTATTCVVTAKQRGKKNVGAAKSAPVSFIFSHK